MHFDEHFLIGAHADISIIHNTFPQDANFSIDSRTLEKGDIFVALKGSRFDGHDAIPEVLEKGASGIFLEENKKYILKTLGSNILRNKLVVVVPNTLIALIKLAASWRTQFDYPVIAITGSVGKTTTREMIANILKMAGVAHITSLGNQNTQIGVSLNILRMRHFHKVAIFELGITRRGEMSKLVDIVRPTTGLITGVGHSHMEGLGSLSDIATEKKDVFKYFTEASIGVVNGDQPILAKVSYNHPVIKFGSKTTNQIQARKIHIGSDNISFLLKIYNKKYNVTMKNTHLGTVFNASAAAAIAHLLNVPHDMIIKGIQASVSILSRFERCDITNERGTLINDCYNASPESMKAALFALEGIDTDSQKIAILGDMLELGVNSPFWHRQLGRFLRKVSTLKHVILVGNMVEWTKKTVPIGITVDHVKTWEDAVTKLEPKLKNKSLVLVKGSNGIQLKNLVRHFTSDHL